MELSLRPSGGQRRHTTLHRVVGLACLPCFWDDDGNLLPQPYRITAANEDDHEVRGAPRIFRGDKAMPCRCCMCSDHRVPTWGSCNGDMATALCSGKQFVQPHPGAPLTRQRRLQAPLVGGRHQGLPRAAYVWGARSAAATATLPAVCGPQLGARSVRIIVHVRLV